MTAAAMALSDSTVMELTGRRINKVNKELSATHVGNSLPGRFFASVFGSLALYITRRLTSRFRDDAIWFKGVAKEAWDANADVRSGLVAIVPRLEKVKLNLIEFRKDVLEIQMGERIDRAHKLALSQALTAAVDLYDAVEEFRWTLLELEANHSPISEGFSATTPEGVAELFRRSSVDA